MSAEQSAISVLIPNHEEPLAAYIQRVTDSTEQVMVILGELESSIAENSDLRERFLSAIKPISVRVRIATRSTVIAQDARKRGIRVIDRLSDLQRLLGNHPDAAEAEREFLPHLWRQHLRSRLQSMGLLSLPRLRIWLLIVLSGALFTFVVFRLLPSATIRIWPKEDTVSQTVNIFLAQTGAIASLPPRVRVMELTPIVIEATRTITYDQISKEFIGVSATATMAIINKSEEPYWLRKGSRLQNQAGMVFEISDSVKVDPGQEVEVKAEARAEDIYGDIIGQRGNVPSGLKWFFPALNPAEQTAVYAENRTAGTGGVTSFKTVLSKEDVAMAKTQLEHELLSLAKQLTDERRDLHNAEFGEHAMDLLYYDELTKVSYENFDLPTEFVGLPVGSVPVSGSIRYTAYAYDSQEVLKILSREVLSHITEGKRILPETLTESRLVSHVIDYADDFSWIKLTIDLSGTEQYILDPLSPTGAVFAKKVRDHVKGLTAEEAKRIVRNFPEVKEAEVSVWPPWSPKLPSIPSHISVDPVLE